MPLSGVGGASTRVTVYARRFRICARARKPCSCDSSLQKAALISSLSEAEGSLAHLHNRASVSPGGV